MVIAAGQASAYGIAVDATNVYWTTNVTGGTVMLCALGGCSAPTTLASEPAPTNFKKQRR